MNDSPFPAFLLSSEVFPIIPDAVLICVRSVNICGCSSTLLYCLPQRPRGRAPQDMTGT